MHTMSMVSGRRSRPKTGPRVPLGVKVLPSIRSRAGRAADAAGISQAWYLEELIERDPVDSSGKPLWAESLPVDQNGLFPLPAGQSTGPRVQLTSLVSPEAHEKASIAAAQLWPPKRPKQLPPIGRYLEILIGRDRLDPAGVPLWLPAPATKTQEEFPLTRTA